MALFNYQVETTGIFIETQLSNGSNRSVKANRKRHFPNLKYVLYEKHQQPTNFLIPLPAFQPPIQPVIFHQLR